MDHSRRPLAAIMLLALVTSACATAAPPAWSFGPPSTPKAPAEAAPVDQPGNAAGEGTTTAAGAGAGAGAEASAMPGMEEPVVSDAPAAPAAVSTAPVADPNAPAYTLYDPKAPELLAGTVHDIDFPIIEKDITVADGLRRPRVDIRRHRARPDDPRAAG